MNSNIVAYNTPQGDKIQLSPAVVRQYLVSGNGAVTDQEVMMFLSLCKYQHLNPFLREAYLVKFGSEPATIITGKEVFTKRAAGIKECKGFEAGVIVQIESMVDYRKGTLVLANEEIVGGWAKVYREDWDIPLEITVSINEYLRRKRDGTPMASWASMPATMIRKVALVQALREAFPEDFGGMYSPEEMPVDTQALPDNPVNLNAPIEEQPVYNNQGKALKEQVITFGKHKGRTLGDLLQNERGYCEWMVKSNNERWSPVFQQLLDENPAQENKTPVDNDTGEVDPVDIPAAVLKMADKAGMTKEDLLSFIEAEYSKPWAELSGNEKSEVTKHLHELGQVGA